MIKQEYIDIHFEAKARAYLDELPGKNELQEPSNKLAENFLQH